MVYCHFFYGWKNMGTTRELITALEEKESYASKVSDGEKAALQAFGVETDDYIAWKKEAFQYVDKQEQLLNNLRQSLREIMDPFQELKTSVTRDSFALYLSKKIYSLSHKIETLFTDEQEQVANFKDKIETLLLEQYNRYIATINERQKPAEISLKQKLTNWWYSSSETQEPLQKPSAKTIALFHTNTMAICAENARKFQAICEEKLNETKELSLAFEIYFTTPKKLAEEIKPTDDAPQFQFKR